MRGLDASRRAGGVEGFESLVPKSDYHAALYRVSIRDTTIIEANSALPGGVQVPP